MEDLYSPPINIRVRDNRQFGRKPLVGIHSVKSLSAFKCKLPSQTAADDSEVDGTSLQFPCSRHYYSFNNRHYFWVANSFLLKYSFVKRRHLRKCLEKSMENMHTDVRV